MTTPTLPQTLRITHRVLMGISLALMLFYLLVYVLYAVNLIQFPFDYDQGEGFELVDAVMFSQGRWPYQSVEPYPFYASNYPPVFHLFQVPFVWVFGPAYWYGRLLGFLGTLVTAYVIGFAVYHDGVWRGTGGHRLMALMAGLAFLASNFIYHIGPLNRQHMTMVMFETLAVVTLAHSDSIEARAARRRTIALGLGLLIVAGYTKQLAAFSAVAVLLWMFLRNPRRALGWGVLFALVGGAIFAWMTWATHGEWWRQAILANVNQTRFDQVAGLFRLWFSLHGWLIVPAVLLCLYELYFERISLYFVWFMLTALLGGVSSGTWGGGDSYFATSIAAACILSGIFFSRWLRADFAFGADVYLTRVIRPLRALAPLITRAALIVVPVLFLAYGRAVLHMPTQGAGFETLASVLNITPNALNGFYDSAGRIAGGYADIGHFVTEKDHAAGWRIVDIIRASDKPTLSEEAGFNLAAGRDVITNPTQLLNVWLRGLYDGSELIGMIESQAFGVVILRAQFYPEPVLIAIERYYEQTETIQMNGFTYIVKRPRAVPLE